MDEMEIVNLAPDMRTLYGQLTRTLRDEKELMLYNLLANQADPFFDREQILIYAKDDTAYQMLQKYQTKLNDLLGCVDTLEIHPPKRNKKKNPKVEKLRALFGDKLVVK